MAEEQFSKPALDKFRQWHFWWLVVFSFLLIITFVYYLPTMFLNQLMAPHAGTPMGTMMPIDESQPHGHDVEGNSMPSGQEGEGNVMNDEETHARMDGHIDMDHEEMAKHMIEGHEMTEEEANQHMDDMMDHEHEEILTSGNSASGEVSYLEESNIKTGLAVNLNISPAPYNIGVPLIMSFFVNNKPGNIPVPVSALEVNHEKKMHVVGLRSDMNEFFHIHPESFDDSGVFTVDHIFNKPGLYKIWSDVQKDGVINLFGHPEVNVSGAGSKEDKKVSFSRNVITGNYQVSLETNDAVVKGREVDMTFDIHTLTGQEINVENYLGAQMHLVFIKDDLSRFIHTHPEGAAHEHSSSIIINTAHAQGDGHTDHTHDIPSMDSGQASGDEVISFKAIFPEAGLYKAFAQFRPEGIDLPADDYLLAEFWIEVKEKASFPVSQWWGLLIISAILMAGLSWWVNGYLKVKQEDVIIKK